MKKTLLCLLVLLVGFGVLFAGGQQEGAKGEPVSAPTEAGTPGAPVKLRALIGFWNTMASTNEAVIDFYERRQMAWAKNHPDVYVEIEAIPGGQTAQAMTKLITAALAGNPHDFANVDSQWVGNFHEAGVLQPIDAYLSADERNQFFDFTKMVTMRDGKQYSIWAETGCLLYYYNKSLVPEAPRTWDDVFALNEDLSGKEAAFLTQGKGAAAAFNFLPMYWAQGGILVDPNDDFRPVFGEGKNREAMVATFKFYQELIEEGAMPPEIVGWEHNDLAAEATAGKAASLIAGTWKWGQLDAIEGADWAYTSLPMRSADQYSNIYGGWTFSFFSKDEQKREESVNYIKEVYTNQDAMAERLPLHGYIPVRKDVFDTDAFSSPFYQDVKKELEVGRARPATSLYPEIESLIEESVGKVVAGNANVEKIVDEMYAKVMSKYENM